MKYMILFTLLASSCGTPDYCEKRYRVIANDLFVNPNTVNDVVVLMEKQANKKVDDLTISIVEEPFDCASIGLRDGCAQSVNGHNQIQIDMYRDISREKITNGDMRCSLLVHELVHYFYGDGNHENPALWYGQDGLTLKLLTHLGCVNQ